MNRMGKKVFVAFLRSPVGSVYYVEGLRVAAGALSGDEDHSVTVAYIGKGVRCALKGVDRSYSVKFLEFFPEEAGKRFLVEKESLLEEGIDERDLGEDFAVASRDELRRMMLEADLCMSF
jgi:sulfur relay (sulfurtransferase) DsrF/TusC family protein